MNKIIILLCISFSYVALADVRRNFPNTGNFEITFNSKVKAQVKIEPFETTAEFECFHYNAPCLINNELAYGFDEIYHPPKTKLSQIIIVNEKSRVELDVSGMYNPNWIWQGEANTLKELFLVQACSGENYCVYRGYFSSWGDSYVAEWVVANGVSRRTILSKAHDIMLAFDLSDLNGLNGPLDGEEEIRKSRTAEQENKIFDPEQKEKSRGQKP